MSKTQPKKRQPPPSNWTFTPRDGTMLEAIHSYDGILTVEQLQTMFFGEQGGGRSQAYNRTSCLYRSYFLDRPETPYEKGLVGGKLAYWLSEKGADYVASLMGDQADGSFYYVKQPRLSEFRHTVIINDIRIAIEQSCAMYSDLEMVDWVPGYDFKKRKQKIKYRDELGKTVPKTIDPDGWFEFLSSDESFRFILEVIRAKYSLYRIIRDKVLPGLAYLKSPEYKSRFGHNNGRFLIVMAGDNERYPDEQAETNRTRAEHLWRKISDYVGEKDASNILITTIEKINLEVVVPEPIWIKPGEGKPVSLLSG